MRAIREVSSRGRSHACNSRTCFGVRALRYNACMASQSIGEALAQALAEKHMSNKELADRLHVNASQVSRWVHGAQIPTAENTRRIKDELGIDLASFASASAPHYELYVSAPITGLGTSDVAEHHDRVLSVVAALREQVDSLYWPGEDIRSVDELAAADVATDHNMRALHSSDAFVFLQFDEIVHPSSSLIELGLALGLRKKVTIFFTRTVRQPYMLEGFQGVAADLAFLPKARIYPVDDEAEVIRSILRNGREMFGLNP